MRTDCTDPSLHTSSWAVFVRLRCPETVDICMWTQTAHTTKRLSERYRVGSMPDGDGRGGLRRNPGAATRGIGDVRVHILQYRIGDGLQRPNQEADYMEDRIPDYSRNGTT